MALKLLEHLDRSTLSAKQGWVVHNLSELERVLNEIGGNSASTDSVSIIDCAKLTQLDTTGAQYLLLIQAKLGPAVQFTGLTARHQSLLELVSERVAACEADGKLRSRKPVLAQLGFATSAFLSHLTALISFLGETVFNIAMRFLAVLRGDFKVVRVKELVVQCEQAFVNAILIVLMLTFLIGVVVAYLFASQSIKYGGSIFIVDAISIAMCRELSPILAAILVAGRSGSAFTAQLGTMKMNEEIDALKVLGLSVHDVLVFPRVFALILTLPLLVFLGNIAGIFGGVVIAQLYLDITPVTFMERMQRVLELKHVYIGLFKAPVFAAFIGIIGCYMGLSSKPDATSVGLNTTSTVVQGIVAVILLNAAFAVILVEMGL